MTTDERNFRSSYYEKVGCNSVEEKKSLNILLKDHTLTRLKLQQFCLSFTVPTNQRTLVWNIILGILPLPVHQNATSYVMEQRTAVYTDVLRAVKIMRYIDENTPKCKVLYAMWLLENKKLHPDTNINEDNHFVEIAKVLLRMFENDVDVYWIAKEFYELTKVIKAELPKLKELTQTILKREDNLLYKKQYFTVVEMEQEIGTWDSVLLENLSEDSFINNIHQRYKRDHIYTYIGTSVVAVNPYRHISEHTSEIIRAYGSKGIFQLPPHIYGLANLAYQSLKDQSEDQCIILLGESGAGKTESFKMVVNFLTHIQDAQRSKLKCPLATSRRRTSSSCSGSYVACPNSRLSTPKKQSTATQHMATGTQESLLRVRAESSDRSSRRNIREKVVDFDFSHHKSTENFDELLPHRHERTSIISTTVPTKSCFKHNYNDVSLSRQKSDKILCDASTNVSMGKLSSGASCGDSASYNVAFKGSPYSTPSTTATGCRQCGHNKCTRQRSFEVDEKACSSSASTISYKMKADVKMRGSCSSLIRQHSNESSTSRDIISGSAISSSRISLFDAHRLNQLYGENLKSNRNVSTTNILMQCRNPRMRECVTCADVFLEAMGNATTLKNNNSSRYGKFFDIEIDFKGDPIGIHITHYPRYTFKSWRKEFSYILSIVIGC